jgi:hypothetical protein
MNRGFVLHKGLVRTDDTEEGGLAGKNSVLLVRRSAVREKC